MRAKECSQCGGTRLRPERLGVLVDGMSLVELCRMPFSLVRERVDSLPSRLPEPDRPVAQLVHASILRRLCTLIDLGLGYLSADRGTMTLSGGEGNRVRLAAQLGAQLTGITYVLDEPTVGLHARDTDRLLSVLERLRDQQNTVVVVEHDANVIRRADHVISLGPGAGAEGGRIVYAGPCEGLSPSQEAPWPCLPRTGNGEIAVRGARAHNLKSVDAVVPLGALTVFAGVSGSGKSSLAFDVLAASIEARRCLGCDELKGWEQVDEVLRVDDAPIGSSPQSSVASFTGLLEDLRNLFAQSAPAKARRLTKSHFSYLSKAGCCPACQGHGQQRVAMDFLGDVWVPCPSCGGKRYRPEILEVTVRGMTISDALDSTVAVLAQSLGAEKTLRKSLVMLQEIGLGHLRAGQPAPSLSGGEARRLRLARALLARTQGRTIFVMDEPTQGLHDEDIGKLIALFARLLSQGHSLWVVEHHLGVIAAAHHVLELGPEAGERGGRVVFSGAPRDLASVDSPTGHALRSSLP